MKKPLIYILLGLVVMFSIWGIVAKCGGNQKPVTKADEINTINKALKDAKVKSDSIVDALPDSAVNAEYERKRAENK
ncbi:hypothetical protein [Runella sp.]|uniref:hypothetical protein n=1 Tax=Runella sp. TaxID=1960881 RepID=UPI003D0CF414